MKRFLMLFICLCMCLGLLPMTASAAPEWPSDVSIQADGGIVMDSDTKTVLYGKNMDQPYYPASITKILTALIVLERCDLEEMVTFSHDDVYNVEAGSSSAGIDEGDVLTVRDCLYALMLASANESANALACHISGSREEFAKLMNEKAESLGCTGSHFANPSGLNDENHYTTAHDMALIARAAIQNPDFLTINGTRSYQLAPTKRTPEGGYVANHHKMLNKNEAVYYSGAFAGKTGYTSLAGNTLVTCARKGDMTLIAVVLNGHQSHYADTKALFDFGFRSFQSLRAADYETRYKALENDMTIAGMTSGDSISLELDRNGRVVIPKDADFTDTQSTLTYDLDSGHPQTAIASILYTYNGTSAGNVYLCSPGLTGSAVSPAARETDTLPASPAQATGSQPASPAQATGSQPASPAQATGSQPVSPGGGDVRGQALPSPAGGGSPLSTRPDITSKEGTAASIRIPANALTVLGIAFSLAAIVAIIAAVKIHLKKKEETDLFLRRQRRLERLEDMGFSSSDFDQLVAQRRLSSPPPHERRRKSRGRKPKKPKKSNFR